MSENSTLLDPNEAIIAGCSVLAGYPSTIWKASSPDNWAFLVNQFSALDSENKLPTMHSLNPDRKWEVVSAYQKAIRRGDQTVAMKMVSAINCRPEFLDYFWRRMIVTAAEDIGPANPGLMAFVMAAFEVFKPKKAPDIQRQVMARLTQMMCESNKSRTYCSMSIIEGAMPHLITETEDTIVVNVPGGLTAWEMEFIEFMKNRPADAPQTVEAWCRSKGALAEGLSKFYSVYPELSVRTNLHHAPVEMICGLPSYAYDMHTRVGKTATFRLCGYKDLKEFFDKVECNDKPKAIGYAMFYTEGGRIVDERWDTQVALLERKMAYARFGLSVSQGVALELILMNLQESGDLNKLRTKIAKATYEGAPA